MFEAPKWGNGLSAPRFLLTVGAVFAILVGIYFGGLWLLMLTGLAIALGFREFNGRQRSKQMRDLANSRRLTFLGDTLTKGFPLHKTSSSSARSLCNCVVGDEDRREILVFDCRLGHGKGSFSRTMVAFRGNESAFGWARFGPDFKTERAGDWAVVYGARRLLTIAEIEALLSELARGPYHPSVESQ